MGFSLQQAIMWYCLVFGIGRSEESDVKTWISPMPSLCFNASTFTGCMNSTSLKLFIVNPSHMFKLLVTCNGTLKGLQTCLLLRNGTSFNKGLVQYSIHEQEGDHITYSHRRFILSSNRERITETCQYYSEYEGRVCCYDVQFNSAIPYSNRTFISMVLLQDTVRLIRSCISTLMIICRFKNFVQIFPYILCDSRYTKLLILRFETELESSNCLASTNNASCPTSVVDSSDLTTSYLNVDINTTHMKSDGNTLLVWTNVISTDAPTAESISNVTMSLNTEFPSSNLATTQSDNNSLNVLRTQVLALGVAFIVLAILVLSAVLFVLFFWFVKLKKNNQTTTFNNGRSERPVQRFQTSATRHTLSYNKESNIVSIPNDDSTGYEVIMEDDEDIYVVPSFEEDAIYEQIEDNSIEYLDRDALKLEAMLGSGQFGEVYKGVWFSPTEYIEVAVKTLKYGSSSEDRIKFLQEVAIMAQFKDPNVVSMYGVVTAEEPILLVLELLSKGDLRNYLLKTRSNDNEIQALDGHILLSYCRQVVSGMVYLSAKGFVHRDLAARNILVSSQEICKIADFGMARNILYESHYTSHGGIIPIKWTAPEGLYYKIYTTASDVWSYGALMYEIWSVGHKPMEHLNNSEIPKVLSSGYRLPPPPGCSRQIYSLMIKCWHPDYRKRPSFMYLKNELSLSDTTLLHWNEEEGNKTQEALQLGSSLMSAKFLYMDLQNTYKKVP